MSLEDFRAAGFRDADEIERERNPQAHRVITKAYVHELIANALDAGKMYGMGREATRWMAAEHVARHLAQVLGVEYGD